MRCYPLVLHRRESAKGSQSATGSASDWLKAKGSATGMGWGSATAKGSARESGSVSALESGSVSVLASVSVSVSVSVLALDPKPQ